MRFPCAVIRFCLSRVKTTLDIYDSMISIIRIISGRHSLFQFFPLPTLQCQSAGGNACDAMCSCRPKCIFFVHLLIFRGNVFRNVREVLVKDVNTPPLMIIRQHVQRIYTCSVTSEKCSSRTLIHPLNSP